MAAILDLFSHFGDPGSAKLILLGSSDFRLEGLMDRARSLHIEHVSPAGLLRRGISQRSPGTEDATALLRKWFFSRKPDAGFILTDFPATLLQAKVLDEWLDARDELLDAVVPGTGAQAPLINHYRTLGLLHEDVLAA